MVTNGDPRIEWVDLDEIAGFEGNPKDHDVGAIVASIERFGYIAPLIRNELTGTLLAGHGRMKALRSMRAAGLDAPGNVRVEEGAWLVPVVAGIRVPPAEEGAYVVADNRTTELGGWVDHLLADLLGSIDLAGTGFDQEDLDRMIRDLGPPEDFPAYDEDIETKLECPKCGYEWS